MRIYANKKPHECGIKICYPFDYKKSKIYFILISLAESGSRYVPHYINFWQERPAQPVSTILTHI